MRVGQQIDLAQRLLAVDRVVVGIRPELPAALAHHRLDHRHADHVFELLEFAEHDGAVRPRAGERDVEMIAPAGGGKAALPARARAAVRRHPIVECGLPTPEAPATRLRVVKAAVPHAVDEMAMGHEMFLVPPILT